MPTAKELGLKTKPATTAADLGFKAKREEDLVPDEQFESPIAPGQKLQTGEGSPARTLEDAYNESAEKQARIYNQISETVGGNLSSKPLDDFSLVADMKRSDDFSEKRAKFMDSYPQGSLIPVQTDEGGMRLVGKTGPDKPYQIVENIPAEMVEAVFNERTIGATAGAIAGGMAGPPGMIGAGIAAGGTFAGSLVGQQAQSVTERFRGYEHDSFTGSLSEDVGGALFDSAIDVATMGLGKLVRAGKKIGPGEVNLGQEIKETIKATERQGLQSLTKGQATESPLIRGIFFQAAGTAGRPRRVTTSQKAQLRKRLEDLSDSEYSSLSDENLGEILKRQQEQLDLLVSNPQTASDEAMESLQKGVEEYKQSSREAVDRLYEQAKTYGDDVTFDISNAKQLAKEVYEGVATRTESGEVKKAGRPMSGELARILKGTKEKAGLLEINPTITTFSTGSSKQSAFDQMKSIRNELFDLKNNENAAGEVRSAAKRLYGQLTESMYNPIGGGEAAKEAFKRAGRANAVREANLEKQKIKQLLRSEDPATLANQFISPNRVGSIETIRELSGDKYFNEIRNYFKTQLLQDPKKGQKMLNEYSKNPRVMDILIPNKSERKMIQKRIDMENKLMNSPISRHFSKMENQAERAFRIAREGSAREMEELLKSAGGGIDGQMAKDMRAGIYAKILNDATTTTQTGQKVVDSNIVKSRIEELQGNQAYKVLFGKKEYQQNLDDLRRASAAMGGDIDVGGSMQAGEARGSLTSGDPGRMTKALSTIGSNELFGYLLSRPADFRKIPTGPSVSMDSLRATTQLMNQLYNRFRGPEVDPEYIKNPQEKAEAAQ